MRFLQLIVISCFLPMFAFASEPPATVRGADELFWVPTLEQGLEMARVVRQFIWVRGGTNSASRITIERVKDGLPTDKATQLARLEPGALSIEALGKELDKAWLAYMKDRPLAARGYLENPHGGWMRSVKQQMLLEESEIRGRAAAGTLSPPGRKAAERPPYLRNLAD